MRNIERFLEDSEAVAEFMVMASCCLCPAHEHCYERGECTCEEAFIEWALKEENDNV